MLSQSLKHSTVSLLNYNQTCTTLSRPPTVTQKTYTSSLPPPLWALSDKTSSLWQKGKQRQALDFHYEDLVRQKTGGKSGFIGIYEIDVITKDALIQCKRSKSARENPRQFIKNAREQIKRTIGFAKQKNKRAEFWFEGGANEEVQRYIKNQGGIYKSDLGENTCTPTISSSTV